MPQKSHRPRIIWRWLRVHRGDDEDYCRWTLWWLPSFSCIYKMHAIAQRPAQMRMCSLRWWQQREEPTSPFLGWNSAFSAQKKNNNNNILYCIISLTRQKKLIGKEEKKSCTHIIQQQQLLRRVHFPHGPLNRYTPRIFDILYYCYYYNPKDYAFSRGPPMSYYRFLGTRTTVFYILYHFFFHFLECFPPLQSKIERLV
jgi:hypothetical protein